MRLKKLQYLPVIAGVLILAGVFFALPSTPDSASPTTYTGPQEVERLVIRYNQGSFELVSRTPLRKILPPTVTLPAPIGEVRGSWFEVESAKGETVYRRRFPAPNMIYTEWPTEDNPGQFSREEVEVAEQVFSILVPKNEKTASLIFYGTPQGQDKRIAASAEIGRLSLR